MGTLTVPQDSFTLTSNSVRETIDLGRTIGRELARQYQGTVIALIGQLGSGKTHFIKGLALGLDVPDCDAVTSPTFTLINEYEGVMMMFHIDAYRLDSDSQLEALGFDEFCAGPSIVVVEWADKVQNLINAYNPVTINLEHLSDRQRSITFHNLPEEIGALICPQD